jgi:putative ATP-grasp target RiPP
MRGQQFVTNVLPRRGRSPIPEAASRAPSLSAALASASEQFGLGRPPGLPVASAGPSSREIRPWGLRRLVRPVATVPLPAGLRYDPVRQVLVDGSGNRFVDVRGDASAESVSDVDGDEGRSEDWRYDFAPDDPGVA